MKEMTQSQLIQSIYNPPLLRKEGPAKELSDLYPKSQIRAYSLARHALLEGLKALKLKKGDSVLLPSFICRDVLAPFHQLGLRPVFYPIDQNLEINVDVATLPPAQAIMAVHYFGLETKLGPFKDYCKLHKAFLIEDNAHGFLSASSTGPLGEGGDIGIVSLRKSLPIENGGLLVAPLSLSLPDQLTPLTSHSLRLRLKNNLRPLVSKIGGSFLMSLTRLKRQLRFVVKGSALPISGSEDETQVPLSPHPAEISPYLNQVDLEAEKQRRRGLYEFFLKELSSLPIVVPRKSLGLFEVPYVFPFFCPPDQLSLVRRKVESMGSELVHWPALPSKVEETAPPYYHQLYLVKFLW